MTAELATMELSGRPVQMMAEDAGSPMGRYGVIGIDVAPQVLDGAEQTVVQILLDDDRPDFDRSLLDEPMVAELSRADGEVLAREPFDHDRFRQRLLAEREAGESLTRGVLVLNEGELPAPWIRLAFLPIALATTEGTTLSVRRTTVAALIEGVDGAYARGELTDQERQAIIVSIDQRHPDSH